MMILPQLFPSSIIPPMRRGERGGGGEKEEIPHASRYH